MTRKIDIVFNSEKDNKSSFQIASGHISETTVHFEKEDVVAVVHAKGSVEFYDMDDKLLATGEVPLVEGGREVYENICCMAEGSLIKIEFPIVEWIDNYPNCDGEYDRWDSRTIGQHTLAFDRVNNSVI